MNNKGQGAVEYIIILGVIILIALIVVTSLGGLGIFNFSATAQKRTTEISNLLADVGFQYVVRSAGSVQVAVKSTTNKQIIAHNMTWYDALANPICQLNMTDTSVRQDFVTFGNGSCALLAGNAGESYVFDCTMRYRDTNGVEHAVMGTCEGRYEE
jgi:hypothetical protein